MKTEELSLTIKKDTDISFIAGQTVIQLFEFSLVEMPVGPGFSIEVIYGDDYPKRVHGVSSQISEPEIIRISIR